MKLIKFYFSKKRKWNISVLQEEILNEFPYLREKHGINLNIGKENGILFVAFSLDDKSNEEGLKLKFSEIIKEHNANNMTHKQTVQRELFETIKIYNGKRLTEVPVNQIPNILTYDKFYGRVFNSDAIIEINDPIFIYERGVQNVL